MRGRTRAIGIAPLLLASLAFGLPGVSGAAPTGMPPRVSLGTEYGAVSSAPVVPASARRHADQLWLAMARGGC